MKLNYSLYILTLSAISFVPAVRAGITLDKEFSCPVEGDAITCMSVQKDKKILVGGNFTLVGGEKRSYLARLDSNGILDKGFSPDVNKDVRRIVLQTDGKILIAGQFSTVGGESRNGIARLNSDGTL